MLDKPWNILGAIAEIHDVPDILDADPRAELGVEPIAYQLQRAREASHRRAISIRIWIGFLTCRASLAADREYGLVGALAVSVPEFLEVWSVEVG
jgi:hypothetical protein